MCGRYTLSASQSDLQALLPGFDVSSVEEARYNIAPTQNVAAVRNDGSRELAWLRWGLIPSWAKEASIGSRMINARSETLAEKPSFRTPFRKRRCLIVADGFYEWRKDDSGAKTPVHIHRPDRKPFTFAGLWETWSKGEGEPLTTCTIVTTEANAALEEVHGRMPVIIAPEDHSLWLTPDDCSPADLSHLLVASAPEELRFHAVSKMVGNVRNQGPELIQAV